MSRDFDEFDEEVEVDGEKELRQHKATLARYKHLHVDERMAKMEALERAMGKATSNPLKNSRIRQNLSKDFLEKFRGDQKPDADLINFLRGGAGSNQGGGHNNDYEPDPTGFEDLPWEEDHDI